MADNIKVAPSAAGKDIAADDISDVLHQRVKVQFGEDGSATDVSATNPLPVTIDATDVVSVDDNGGSLTVDGTVAIDSLPLPPDAATATNQTTANTVLGATTDAAVTTDTNGTLSAKLRGLVKWAYERMPASLGQKTMANSLPVVVASDQSSLGITTGATDAAAAAGQIFPTAVRRVNTVVDLADGALGYVRGTPRQAVITAPDWRIYYGDSSQPSPATTDILRPDGSMHTSSDYQIRDTSIHSWIIPMMHYRNIEILFFASQTWSHALTATINSGILSVDANRQNQNAILSTFTLMQTGGQSMAIGCAAAGLGATTPASPATDRMYIPVPQMANTRYVNLQLKAATAPTTGNIISTVYRS